MILFIILLITLLVLAAIAILAISLGGAAVVILFGDVILCMLFIVWIIKRLIKRKK